MQLCVREPKQRCQRVMLRIIYTRLFQCVSISALTMIAGNYTFYLYLMDIVLLHLNVIIFIYDLIIRYYLLYVGSSNKGEVCANMIVDALARLK